MSENLFGLGTGITITTGFDVATQKPLDSRTVVNNITELNALPADRVYIGLLVHVVDEDKLYQWKKKTDDKGQILLDKDGQPIYDWGPIEAEVSAKEPKTEEMNFKDTPSLLLQKNKADFFPITHEKYIVNDDGKTLDVVLSERFQETEKEVQQVVQDLSGYQLKKDNNLQTDNKEVVKAINEIYVKMDTAIDEFEERINKTLADLDAEIETITTSTRQQMEQAKKDIQASMDEMNATMEKAMDDMDKEIASKMKTMDDTFATKMAEINTRIAGLENEINIKINNMLQDVDNVIMTDLEVTNVMNKINTNITNVNKI